MKIVAVKKHNSIDKVLKINKLGTGTITWELEQPWGPLFGNQEYSIKSCSRNNLYWIVDMCTSVTKFFHNDA